MAGKGPLVCGSENPHKTMSLRIFNSQYSIEIFTAAYKIGDVDSTDDTWEDTYTLGKVLKELLFIQLPMECHNIQ